MCVGCRKEEQNTILLFSTQQRRLCHLTRERESTYAVLVEVILLIKATGNSTFEQFCVCSDTIQQKASGYVVNAFMNVSSQTQQTKSFDPLLLATYHAEHLGIVVVCSDFLRYV